MSLMGMWTARQLEGKKVSQIIAIAGDGKLRDGSDTSKEFRELLSVVPSDVLSTYANDCLTNKFEDGGLALQDIINQVGRRLGFQVGDGRYRGIAGQVGNDGLWSIHGTETILVEVKTTDAYRINLDTVAEYRRSLVRKGEITEDFSSILIIVGRDDTGDLEAQIRGSRYSWDMRLISIDGILRLLSLKESTDEASTHKQIRNILKPCEFTKLDGIIDLVFVTAEDIREDLSQDIGPTVPEKQPEQKLGKEQPRREKQMKAQPLAFNDACVARIQAYLVTPLVKQSRTIYSSSDGRLALSCAVSNEYESRGITGYWFAFHLSQKERLEEATTAYVAFGCGSEARVLLIPYKEFETWLDWFSTHEDGNRILWHVSIFTENDNRLMLRRKQGYEPIELSDRYLLPDRS